MMKKWRWNINPEFTSEKAQREIFEAAKGSFEIAIMKLIVDLEYFGRVTK